MHSPTSHTLKVAYDKLIEGLGLTSDQFVDLCIMCGCDYCDKIPGIGPKTALKLIKKHGCLEEIVKYLDPAKVQTRRSPRELTYLPKSLPLLACGFSSFFPL